MHETKGLRVVPPSIGRYLVMPPQDLPTQSHAPAATDKAAVLSPVVVPAVSGHGKERKLKERKRRRKHEDGAAGGGVFSVAPSENDAADGAHHRRRPGTPASERTRTEADSSKYDDGGSNTVFYLFESAPVTARTNANVIDGSRKSRAAGAVSSYSRTGGGNSYYASDNHYVAASSRVIRERRPASPRPHSKPAKPHAPHYPAAFASAATADGVPARYDSPSVAGAARPGGKHRHRQAANHADDYAAASISSLRLVIREPAAPPPEPSEDELLRVGLEVASKMDMSTLRSTVKEYVVSRNEEAEAVEEERPPFWRPLTDDEVDADLRAVYDKVAARRAAASGSGKRRRH
jgi:hypothetical protein